MIKTTDYRSIISCVNEDFSKLEQCLMSVLESKKNRLFGELCSYVFSSSKRIRSCLIFLFARAIDAQVTDYQLDIAAAVEFIHNATLIHDDIIDEADKRRQSPTLNKIYDGKLAVIAGDYLLSLALSLISKSGSQKVLDIFVETLENLCSGEIDQYFTKNHVTSIEDYVKKSENKTAKLFCTGLRSAFIDQEQERLYNIENFALNFGIAFQVRDDLSNFLSKEADNKAFEDIKNGIYTAPIIYSGLENFETDSLSIVEKVLQTDAVDKTKALINYYSEKAIESLTFLEDNIYGRALNDLCMWVREV